jgi:hypothetical protein
VRGNLPPEGFEWGQSAGFRVGDKLINVRNNPELGVVNGDIGYLVEFVCPGSCGDWPSEPTLRVLFESPEREINIPARKHDLGLAYCLTAHKYQGSEAPCIVLPVHKCFGGLIVQRNWVYTAISRAAKLCVVVGSQQALEAGVRRVGQQARYSRLAASLARGIQGIGAAEEDSGGAGEERAPGEVVSLAAIGAEPAESPAPLPPPLLLHGPCLGCGAPASVLRGGAGGWEAHCSACATATAAAMTTTAAAMPPSPEPIPFPAPRRGEPTTALEILVALETPDLPGVDPGDEDACARVLEEVPPLVEAQGYEHRLRGLIGAEAGSVCAEGIVCAWVDSRRPGRRWRDKWTWRRIAWWQTIREAEEE